jgi:hypothetical protein
MANEFKIKKGLLVNGSGSVIVSVDGSQGQLFSVTDSLEGTLLSVTDISGIPILDVSSDNTVKMGTFNNEGLIVTGSNIRIQTPITTGSVTHIPVFTNNPTSSNQLLSGMIPSVFISQNGIATTGSNTFIGNQTINGLHTVSGSTTLQTINNGIGDILTVSGSGLITKRTVSEIYSDIGVGTSVIQSLGSISGTVNINLSVGTLITATLTGSTTLSFIGLPSSNRELGFTLRFSGIQEIIFPTGTKFANGVPPTPSGDLYEIPCSIDSSGNVIVYGSINNIIVP